MRSLLLFLLGLISFCASAQILEPKVRDSIKMDSIAPVADLKYREDQMYASLAYNLIQSKPGGYSQYSFSTALTLGFLRDMPVNKRRTYAIAAGLGYSYNNIKQNLIVQPVDNGVNSYQVVKEGSFDKNKLVLHYLELPIELRWRNSDSIEHKFWRVYLGFKVSYLFSDKATYKPGDSPAIKIKNDKNLNDFLYGAYVSAGWNTWNFYAYYGLTPIYNNAPIVDSSQKLTLKSLNFGLIFYIL